VIFLQRASWRIKERGPREDQSPLSFLWTEEETRICRPYKGGKAMGGEGRGEGDRILTIAKAARKGEGIDLCKAQGERSQPTYYEKREKGAKIDVL